MLADRYQGRSGQPIELRADFVASVVPGSLRVFSLVSDEEVAIGARIENGKLLVLAEREVSFNAFVAGINLHFPDFDMPKKSDQQRDRSWNFWAQEWKP